MQWTICSVTRFGKCSFPVNKVILVVFEYSYSLYIAVFRRELLGVDDLALPYGYIRSWLMVVRNNCPIH